MTTIQELIELDNPKARRELGLELLSQGASIAEVRKRTGASENTVKSWRRRAKAASGHPSPEAVAAPRPQAPEAASQPEMPEAVKTPVTGVKPCSQGCGTQLDTTTDETVLGHWANECPKVSGELQCGSWIKLERLRRSKWTSTEVKPTGLSTLPNSHLSNSVDSGRESITPSLPDTTDTANTERMGSMESITPSHESLPVSDDDYAAELKRELWPDSTEELDPYYDKFSPVTGDVVPGWSMAEWTLGVTGGVKFPSRDCTTVTRPRRKT